MEELKKKKISFEEYLEIEQSEGIKYEYHKGEIFAMAGGTNNHGRICMNISVGLYNQLAKKTTNCEAFSSETKLYIPTEDRAFYPDSMVICEANKEEGTEHFMTNPTVIVEVLSDSTEIYDRTDKFRYYRRIPTLREYILISQKQAEIEVFKKMSDMWGMGFVSGLKDTLYIQSLDIKISMRDIYLGVEFEEKVA